MSIQESQVTIETLDEKSVLDFLIENPEFFIENADILPQLNIPHASGNAISLIEYQVRVLREQNEKLNKKLKMMLNNARVNDRLNEKIFNLAYRLIDCHDLEDALCIIEETLFDNFEANNVAIKLFDPNSKLCQTRFDSRLDKDDPTLDEFKVFMESSRPQCGRLNLTQLEFLFGTLAKQVQSTALVPIGRQCQHGFLAIGSHETKRFHPGKDTTFLAHLSNLITSAIKSKL